MTASAGTKRRRSQSPPGGSLLRRVKPRMADDDDTGEKEDGEVEDEPANSNVDDREEARGEASSAYNDNDPTAATSSSKSRVPFPFKSRNKANATVPSADMDAGDARTALASRPPARHPSGGSNTNGSRPGRGTPPRHNLPRRPPDSYRPEYKDSSPRHDREYDRNRDYRRGRFSSRERGDRDKGGERGHRGDMDSHRPITSPSRRRPSPSPFREDRSRRYSPYHSRGGDHYRPDSPHSSHGGGRHRSESRDYHRRYPPQWDDRHPKSKSRSPSPRRKEGAVHRLPERRLSPGPLHSRSLLERMESTSETMPRRNPPSPQTSTTYGSGKPATPQTPPINTKENRPPPSPRLRSPRLPSPVRDFAQVPQPPEDVPPPLPPRDNALQPVLHHPLPSRPAPLPTAASQSTGPRLVSAPPLSAPPYGQPPSSGTHTYNAHPPYRGHPPQPPPGMPPGELFLPHRPVVSGFNHPAHHQGGLVPPMPPNGHVGVVPPPGLLGPMGPQVHGNQSHAQAQGMPLPSSSMMPPPVPTKKKEAKMARVRTKEEEEALYGRYFVGSGRLSEYDIAYKLGEGTFGEVHKAVHRTTGAIVALKRILMHNEKDGMPITALREIKLLKALDHPNVLKVLDVVVTPRKPDIPGSVHMVSPYMDHDLAGLLENPSVKLAPSHIKLYMKQLLEGLEYMHDNNVVHRDIKAANLLINHQGVLQIGDFGLARSFSRGSKTEKMHRNDKYTNCVVTRWYRPPELLMGERYYGGEIDIWGVGCILAEMFTRKPIIPGNSDMDQLERIWSLCGTPTPQSWPDFETLPGLEGVKSFKPRPRVLLDVFGKIEVITSETLDLINRILVLDPSKRPTASEALLHNYFWSDPLPAKHEDMPKFESSHEMDRRKRHEPVQRPPPQPQNGPPFPRHNNSSRYPNHYGNHNGRPYPVPNNGPRGFAGPPGPGPPNWRGPPMPPHPGMGPQPGLPPMPFHGSVGAGMGPPRGNDRSFNGPSNRLQHSAVEGNPSMSGPPSLPKPLGFSAQRGRRDNPQAGRGQGPNQMHMGPPGVGLPQPPNPLPYPPPVSNGPHSGGLNYG